MSVNSKRGRVAFSKLRICGNSFNKCPNCRMLSHGGGGATLVFTCYILQQHINLNVGLTPPAPTPSGISSLLSPSICPRIMYLSLCVYSMCVFGCFGSPAGCVGSGRRRKRKNREELMGAGAAAPVEHDSVWVHQCPWGKKHTKHVPKTHCCRPSCNQCVQMDTFPRLTSISMSLIPAAWSSYNSNDRRATEKALVQSLFGLSCTERAGNVCWAPSLLQSLCCALALRMRRPGETAQTGTHNRGRSVYSPRGGGALAHLFKQPEISWGNENVHLCRTVQILHAKSPFTSSPGSLTIFCFHSWIQERLSLPRSTSTRST